MNPDRGELAAVFLGGAAGALARVGLTRVFLTATGHWPWTVFAINLAGALALGFLMRYIQRRGPHRLVRPLLGPGFCGAFTTFSTLQLEVLDMIRSGHGWLALLYVTASVLAGLLAVGLGTRLADGSRPGGTRATPPRSASTRSAEAARRARARGSEAGA